ncbi:ABC transporter ATP-binding protein [Pseudoalteromonas phenolica]|uniref:ABC transporter ATP-binding protein n=1 Tax=Pseudoalteromonas phenolica TaxID=161398 RepID=A0A5R9Q6K5_9GAMM|nr:ABC transporter ATP-binding protein [Pseudoalteromonas phenolica]TLX48136.1 ABC transporter ATP-binding protein [Pseudoalteromonas phenolica]
MTNSAVVSVNNLHHSYGDKSVLKGLDFSLKAGRVYGFLGANGAGKTTLINLLLGRLKASQGSVEILGNKAGSVAAKAKVGAMLQIGSLPANLTVLEQLNLFASYYQSPMPVSKALRLSDLNAYENTPFSKLSGGLKQRLLFAIAIIGDPQLVFLDEPSLAMDVNARQQMWQTIRQLKAQDKTVVLTTHYMEEAEALSDELFILNEGKIIAQGSPSELSHNMQLSEVSFASELNESELSTLLPEWSWQVNEGKAKTRCKSPNTLLKQAFANGLSCDLLSVKPSSLEQTFLSLTETAEHENKTPVNSASDKSVKEQAA